MRYGVVMTWTDNGTEKSKLVAIGYKTKEEAQAFADKKNAWNEKEFGKYNVCNFHVVESKWNAE